jgi:hypothetical protein
MLYHHYLTNQLYVFKDRIAVYWENEIKYINMPWGNLEIINFETDNVVNSSLYRFDRLFQNYFTTRFYTQ